MERQIGMLRLAGIVQESIVDGPGIRMTVFGQGCPHACPGCHNPHTHSFEGGALRSVESILAEIRENPLLAGITLSGGEPFGQAAEFARLARGVKAMGRSVITYTGYTFEALLAQADRHPGWRELLAASDYLMDGRFIEARRTYDLPFRGSDNQRFLDAAESMRQGRAVSAEAVVGTLAVSTA